jgi:hypothetical protein
MELFLRGAGSRELRVQVYSARNFMYFDVARGEFHLKLNLESEHAAEEAASGFRSSLARFVDADE